MTTRTQIPPKESIESMDRESMVGLVVSMFEKICSLEKRLEYYERREYGRRSERHTDYDPNQLLLFEDCSFTEEEKEVVDSLMQETPAKEKSAKSRKKSRPHGRKPLSVTGLPTETVDVYPEGVLDSDGNLLPEYEEIGTEVSESLEMAPAKFYRRRLVRHKVVKKEGEGSKSDPEHTRVMTPALLPDEKERLKAGNSVLADLLIKKFREYLTYYRAVDIYKELGGRCPGFHRDRVVSGGGRQNPPALRADNAEDNVFPLHPERRKHNRGHKPREETGVQGVHLGREEHRLRHGGLPLHRRRQQER